MQAPQKLTPSRADGDELEVWGGALRAEDGVCPAARQHSEYDGAVVRWGADHILDDAGACCAACAAEARCNAWVFCDAPGGCSGGSRPRGECWLKEGASAARPAVSAHGPSVGWTSGALFDAHAAAAAAAQDDVERAALKALRYAPGNPRVFIDVQIEGAAPRRVRCVRRFHGRADGF